MKNLEMNESKIDVVNGGYDFDGFGDDLYDNFVDDESPIESLSGGKLDTAKIDELVKNEDYMGFGDYLDELDDDQRIQAQEYVQNNFPEFLQDDGGNIFEPMKGGNVSKDKEFHLDKKTHFNRNIIKDELGDVLVESYKNAA